MFIYEYLIGDSSQFHLRTNWLSPFICLCQIRAQLVRGKGKSRPCGVAVMNNDESRTEAHKRARHPQQPLHPS